MAPTFSVVVVELFWFTQSPARPPERVSPLKVWLRLPPLLLPFRLARRKPLKMLLTPQPRLLKTLLQPAKALLTPLLVQLLKAQTPLPALLLKVQTQLLVQSLKAQTLLLLALAQLLTALPRLATLLPLVQLLHCRRVKMELA